MALGLIICICNLWVTDMGITKSLSLLIMLICANGICEDVGWPEIGEYRNNHTPPAPRRTYTPEYKPRKGYYKHYQSCTACRYSFSYVYNPKSKTPTAYKNPVTGKAYYNWHDYMRSLGVKFYKRQ
jgi:hypothetical protein